MISLEHFFQKHSFQCFTYETGSKVVKLANRNDNTLDSVIFDELKVIVDQLMKLPIDFHILDNGDIEIDNL